MATGFRADLPLDGRSVLVVGGGPDALPRIAGLRAARAAVTVLASGPLPAVLDLAERELLTLISGDLATVDLRKYWLVIAATGNAADDRVVAALSEEARVMCLPGSGLTEAAAPATRGTGGRVLLVGGGPGDPGLLTVAGADALREADVVISDRLAPLEALSNAKRAAEFIDVSKIPHGTTTEQEEINRLLIEHARAGKVVVRFKGGDPFVFGRGGEELEACRAAGVPVTLIPGVTSAIAAPALAGIPVTHRGLNQGFTVLSGHVAPDDRRCTIDYPALARSGTALVLLMAVATLPAITTALLDAGMPPDTPAATIADAGLASQREIRATVETIAQRNAQAQIRSPAVTVIGAVAGFGAQWRAAR